MPLRVVVLADRVPPHHQGGAEIVAWRMAEGLHTAGITVHVITTHDGAPYEETRGGIVVHTLHSRYPERWRAYLSLYNLQVLPALESLLARLKPDVVHAHNVHTHLSYYSLEVARRLGIPTVLTAHDVMPFAYGKLTHFVRADNCDVPLAAYRLPPLHNLKRARLRYNPLRNPIIKRVLGRVTRRLAVSQALADALHANGLPPFAVLHNGIDTASWQTVDTAHVAALRDELNLANKRVLLFGGRLTREKGTSELLAALRLVRRDVTNVAVLLLSARPLDQQLTPTERQEFADLLINGGWRTGDALQAAFAAACAVVVPSVYLDPLPTMTLEAGAAGKPTVVTCFGGGREVVQDGSTGYVVNPLQTEMLAQRLTTLLSDDALAARIGQAAAVRVRDHFSMTRWIEATLRVYHTLR